jgi:uncharacterized small protein (DUF1192 family)
MMFNPDDLEPRKAQVKPKDLQPLSVEDLHTYIEALEQEIARAEEMIAKKQAHKSGIDALFGGSKE